MMMMMMMIIITMTIMAMMIFLTEIIAVNGTQGRNLKGLSGTQTYDCP